MLDDKTIQLDQWKECFAKLLNVESIVVNSNLKVFFQQTTRKNLPEHDSLSVEEACEVAVKLVKLLGPKMLLWLNMPFFIDRKTDVIPRDWKTGIPFPL
ncbi:hypothetical protein QYM36_014621 [Artemia franciscana]|uniref:Uncharacterized protein n=1 Tax=Artemia franciscana TaxID=6661 RepID=A0AA88L3M0_ARTSF|nr:hypothetical protein QYM36_014621 [Artemia franciscana]